MSDSAHRVQTTVSNIEDECTAVAIATDWLRDVLPALDIVQADASSGVGETTVDFILRLSDRHIEDVKESNGYLYLGEC